MENEERHLTNRELWPSDQWDVRIYITPKKSNPLWEDWPRTTGGRRPSRAAAQALVAMGLLPPLNAEAGEAHWGHINHDTLDNDPRNFVAQTHCESMADKPSSLSVFPGVSWNGQRRRWRAEGPRVKGERKSYGRSFEFEHDAARAVKSVWEAHPMYRVPYPEIPDTPGRRIPDDGEV